MKSMPSNIGILLLLEELSPEWNKLQDKEKNLGIPVEKADPSPGMDEINSSGPEPGVGRKHRPRLKAPRKRRYRY